MDDYGIDDNYMLKIVAGVIIGLLVLFLVVPLAANIIATQNVANTANSALNNVETSLPSTAGNVIPTATNANTTPSNVNTTPANENTTNNSNTNTNNPVPKQETTPSTDGMTIISGTISTGSSLSSKSICTIYVGEQYAGASIKMSTLYSRDGTDLNAGRLVDKTVDSSGYVTLPSADSYKLYPDECLISIYDAKGNQLDYRTVYLETESGTQSF